jgi:hypothetical protein
MKKLSKLMMVAFCLGLFMNESFAQNIPNAGFENWTTQGFPAYENPANWGTLNSSTAIISVFTTVKATGTDAYSGNSAIKLISKFIAFAGQTAPGMATTGTINTNTQAVEGGFVYTQRPIALTGWYKANPQTGDKGSIEVKLWRRVGGVEEVVGEAILDVTTPVSTYTRFVLPINYNTANAPDSARLILFSSDGANAVAESELIVDDLEFVFCTGFSVAVATTDETANGAGDGTAQANITGGATPFTYEWNNSSTTQSLNGLPSGAYCVTVTDNNGCTATACNTVSSPSCAGFSVVVNATDITYFGTEDGTVAAVVTGGTSPYDYDWSNGQTSETDDNLAPGQYCVTVTDAAACVAIACGTVGDIDCSALGVGLTVTDATGTTANDGSITALATGGAAPYDYDWNGNTGETIDNLAPDTYCVLVTDNLGCEVSNCATVGVDPSTGINSFVAGNIKLFPNPVQNELMVTLNDKENHTLYLFDVSGKLQLSVALNNSNNTVATTTLSNGVYFYQIKNETNGVAINGKLVKQ